MKKADSLEAKWAEDVVRVRRALKALGLTIDDRGIAAAVAAEAGLPLRATQRALRALVPR